MIYLDYSANTPVDARVLERFCAVERRCMRAGTLSPLHWNILRSAAP